MFLSGEKRTERNRHVTVEKREINAVRKAINKYHLDERPVDISPATFYEPRDQLSVRRKTVHAVVTQCVAFLIICRLH
jgi:hypothetical protein